jgi:Recombination endonuclease VII
MLVCYLYVCWRKYVNVNSVDIHISGNDNAGMLNRYPKKPRSAPWVSPTIDPISREDARAAGMTIYFLPEPCKKGHISVRSVTGGYCMQCHREASLVKNMTDDQVLWRRLKAKEFYQNHTPEQTKRHRANSRKTQTGMTEGLYHTLIQEQAGLCAVCGKQMMHKNEPHADHDHKTGRVRGLLCVKCNTRLEIIENEEWMIQAAEYLRRYAVEQ